MDEVDKKIVKILKNNSKSIWLRWNFVKFVNPINVNLCSIYITNSQQTQKHTPSKFFHNPSSSKFFVFWYWEIIGTQSGSNDLDLFM